MEDRKYYEAYDERYRQIHELDLKWFMEGPSEIVLETMESFGIGKESRILELGCGEGRDANFLLRQGYQVLATDVSSEAVAYCRKHMAGYEESFRFLDCVKERMDEKFDFIYAVAVVHMLVEDEDRAGFYGFYREQLKENGIGLICTMGDGEMERKSDVATAFDLQERVHEQSGKRVCIAGTSYRAVSFDTFRYELEENGLEILQEGFTDVQPDYWKMMYAVVRRKR